MKFHDAHPCKSRWGHEVFYHDVDVHSFKIPLLLFVVAILVLHLGLLALFFRRLLPLKPTRVFGVWRPGRPHGRLARRRWIAREPGVESPLLQAAELG